MIAGTIDSCKKKIDYGEMTIKLTDAPADYVQVNVDVIGLEVEHETEGFINIPIYTGVYNLLDLQNNVSVILAEKVKIPEGKINQIRLILGTNNTLITNLLDTFSLKIPSGSESGLKINIDEVIIPDKTIVILLDFDANTSVVDTGGGKFLLKPVIKVKSVNQI
ncbi:MAG: hypothetical protein A2046_09365 [Bacteroidetes bacterium GWA2_30_7]|nr:MAG: hypothetical protein A2046_09365 [Bacteroidetes bacterium GWA2_30_7]